VIIPNWNGRDHLPECLAALDRQTLPGAEVVVVDNDSTDDGVAWIEECHPHVVVRRLRANCGFAAAVNEGIRATDREYVALLNNDAMPEPRWLEELVGALERRPGYDFAASLMIFYANPGRVNAAGDTYDLLRLVGRNRGFGQPVAAYQRPARTLGACAGAALYRRSLFDEVGLFDEDFFLMSEDTDFNLRCLVAGKRCLYVPSARVRHKFRASIGTVPEWRTTRLAARNEALVAAKDLPTELLPVAALVWPWRFLRETMLLRPGAGPSLAERLRRMRGLALAEAEGARLGIAKRGEVRGRGTVPTRQVLRWLARGVGPV